jgi:hypothetical protein
VIIQFQARLSQGIVAQLLSTTSRHALSHLRPYNSQMRRMATKGPPPTYTEMCTEMRRRHPRRRNDVRRWREQALSALRRDVHRAHPSGMEPVQRVDLTPRPSQPLNLCWSRLYSPRSAAGCFNRLGKEEPADRISDMSHSYMALVEHGADCDKCNEAQE